MFRWYTEFRARDLTRSDLKPLRTGPNLWDRFPHDTGLAPLATALPAKTPAVDSAAISIDLRAVQALFHRSLVLEAEPNNAPEQATDLSFPAPERDQVLYVIGGSDEIDYYNNTETGTTPDDWYRIEYRGTEPKFLSANLQIVEPVVSARIRVYKEGLPSEEELSEREVPNSYDFANFNPIPYVHPPAVVVPGPVPVYTYEEGRALNERAHQQESIVPDVCHAKAGARPDLLPPGSKRTSRTTKCRCASSIRLPMRTPSTLCGKASTITWPRSTPG